MTLFQTLFQQLAAFLAMRSQPSSCCRSAKTTDAFSAVIAIIIIIIAAPAYSLAQTVNLAFDDANEQVNAIAEDNIYVYIGGNFTIAAGQPRRGIARFVKTTGVLDMSWNPSVLPPHAGIDAMTVTHDAVYVGGTFSVTIGQKTWNGIIKLSTSTAEIDTTWNPAYPPRTTVSALANAHNSIYVALNHTVHKLSATTGEQDPLWKPYVPTFIRSMVVSGNSLYIAGLGNGGVKKVSLTTGTADPFWFFHSLDWIHTLAVSNSHVFIGGISGYTGWGGRGILERLSSLTGSRDNTWKARTSTYLHAIAVAGDDMYVGGIVTTIDGQIKSQGLVKISSLTGDIDNNWNAYPLPHNLAPDWYHLPNIRCLLASGSSLYVGGQFTSIAGKPRKNFAVIDINAYNSPVITSFTPTSGSTATVVTITGINFTGATAVSFGGVPATTFTVVSPTQITAVVGAGASGNVTVVTPNGTATAPGFVYITPPPPPTPAPVITSFTPTSGSTATVVTITGMNFTGATAVSFGGVPATTFTVISPTQITAVVGAGASGNVTVVTPNGTATAPGFVYIAPPPPPTPVPVITSFTPTSGSTATVVTITGMNFTGATAVSFGGVPATTFTVVSPTQITAVVGAGASGNVTVVTPNGTATAPGFVYIAPPPPPTPVPVITSFTPTSGSTATVVTITGMNFTGATAVSFGGVPAATFTVVSPTQITAVVGAGTSGNISVVTPGGTATAGGFIHLPPPTIVCSPLSSTAATVTITGNNFTGTTSVSFGGIPASAFTVVSPTTITATIAFGSTDGSIHVTTPNGSASCTGFIYQPLKPIISSFSPAFANTGTVDIFGDNFRAISSVRFGGVSAASFVVLSHRHIRATLGSGASGAVEVVNPDGTARFEGFVFSNIPPIPNIGGFSPACGTTGTVVTITGSGFAAAKSVRFGNSPASFLIDSDTQIRATVQSGATGAVTVTSLSGTHSLPGFTYIADLPTITSFTPTNVGTGGTVTIIGTNFIASCGITTQRVTFGGTPAASFITISPTEIQAVVGSGASGTVQIERSDNAVARRTGFLFAAPVITGFSPSSGTTGTTVVITGTNFSTVTGASAVRVNNVNVASYVVNSDTQITAILASNHGLSGSVVVTNPNGSGSRNTFTFVPPPIVDSFFDSFGTTGATITINGRNFTGAYIVKFGAMLGSIISVTPTRIVATVGTGATGALSVTTPGGVGSRNTFRFAAAPITPPTIVNVVPNPVSQQDSILTITGASLGSATAVLLNSLPLTFVSISATQVRVRIPVGAASGTLTVYTHGGTATVPVTVMPLPTITGFTPTSGGSMTLVTITGTGFLGTSGAASVRFGSANAASYTVVSDNTITAVVAGGATGTIRVITPGGTVFSSSSFTFIPPTPPPTITSFTLDIGVSGTTITIRGTNFTGATSVSIGGMPAASFTVVSPTEITATVGAGASGNIIVSTPSGTASSAALGYTYTFLTSPIPVITSFAPAAGIVGSSVTIMGQNLTGTTKVTIGGVVASFTVISATEITATVPSGATTGRIHVFKEAVTPIQFAVSATDYTVIPTLFLNANTANDEQPTTANEDLKTFATEEFTAYPSRVTDCLTLMYNTQSSGRIRFSIVNALGNVVWTFEQEGTGTVLHEVDMSRFAPGMYIVELRSNNRRSIRKVVRY